MQQFIVWHACIIIIKKMCDSRDTEGEDYVIIPYIRPSSAQC